MIEGSVTADAIHIHYRINGKGPETLVLVNGVGDDLEAWANQIDDFVSADLRVVSFDNRGVGLSSQPPGPYTSAEMAADLHLLVTELELSQLHLAGVSMGGVIAQEYAIAHGDRLRSLVLANTYAAPHPFNLQPLAQHLVAQPAVAGAVVPKLPAGLITPTSHASARSSRTRSWPGCGPPSGAPCCDADASH